MFKSIASKFVDVVEMLKKKDSSAKFYKSTIDNKSYFYKQKICLTTNRQKIEGKLFFG